MWRPKTRSEQSEHFAQSGLRKMQAYTSAIGADPDLHLDNALSIIDYLVIFLSILLCQSSRRCVQTCGDREMILLDY